MFFFDKLRITRLGFKNPLRGKKPYNIEANVFVFDETTNNLVGLNEKLYDSVAEKSIAGKNITVGSLLMNKHGFKYEIKLAEYIRDALHFNLVSFETRKPAELFRGVENETIDFLSVAFGVNADPQLHPTIPVKHELYMREPSAGFSSTFFVRVFEPNVWCAVLGTIIASCFVLGMYNYFMKKSIINYMEILYFTLGIADVPNSTLMTVSLRAGCFFISLFMLLIMGAFSTFLTAELTVKELHLPFQDLDQILLQTEYSLCVPPGSYIQARMEDQGHLDIFNGGNCPTHGIEEYDFTECICNREKTVYFSTDDDVYDEIFELHDGIPPCKIYVFKDRYFPVYRAMPTKNTFKYTRQMSRVITQLRTSGVLYFLFKKVIGLYEVNMNPSVDEDLTAIEYEHVQLMLMLLIIFMFVSFIILLLEVASVPNHRNSM